MVKKQLMVTIFCLIVIPLMAICGIVGIFAVVYAPHDDIILTEVAAAGDITTANGLQVQISATQNNHLFWDISHTFGETAETSTEYMFHSEDYYPSGSIYYSGVSLLTDISTEVSLGSEAVTPIQKAYAELYASIDAGEMASKVIRLRDYYEYYPLSVQISLPECRIHLYSYDRMENPTWGTDLYIVQAFENYFKIPVLESHEVEISVSKGNTGGSSMTTGIGYSSVEGDAFYMSTFGVLTEDAYYFTFDPHSILGVEMDMTHIPGGYGIYRFFYGETESGEVRPDVDSLEMVCSLDTAYTPTRLSLTPEGDALLLLTIEEENSLWLSVISLETMEVVQRLTIAQDNGGLYTLYEEENFLVCHKSLELFVVLTRSNSVFSSDGVALYEIVMRAERDDEGTISVGNDYNINALEMAFDGERLAVVSGVRRKWEGYYTLCYCDFVVTVYTGDGTTYSGYYQTSLNAETDGNNSEYYCCPIENDSISVGWLSASE